MFGIGFGNIKRKENSNGGEDFRLLIYNFELPNHTPNTGRDMRRRSVCSCQELNSKQREGYQHS